MMTLADDLAAAIAAREAATKGPWKPYLLGVVVAEGDDAEPEAETSFSAEVYGPNYDNDASFIALAANVIEAHGAELAALVDERRAFDDAMALVQRDRDLAVAENARLRAAAKRLSGVAADHYSAGTDEARRWADAVNEFDAEVRAALRGPS